MEELLRYIFISRGTPTYENVYRPQKVDSGERKSITASLLSGKFYVKICYIFYIYSTISRGTPDDGVWNPRVPGNPGWETLLHTEEVRNLKFEVAKVPARTVEQLMMVTMIQ
jgi:hypothetical protein